jgi:hypothetical protein
MCFIYVLHVSTWWFSIMLDFECTVCKLPEK